jgi:hypothetical protein
VNVPGGIQAQRLVSGCIAGAAGPDAAWFAGGWAWAWAYNAKPNANAITEHQCARQKRLVLAWSVFIAFCPYFFVLVLFWLSPSQIHPRHPRLTS